MALVKFELPDELLGITADTINRDMLAKISNAYDKTEGGFLSKSGVRPLALAMGI